MSFLKYLIPDPEQIKIALTCKCPKCKSGALYGQNGFMTLNDACPNCGLDLTKCDSADGPAVFLIFILGAILVPAALLFELYVEPPLWMHAALWGIVGLGIILGTLPALKAYIIALQYKHLPWD